MKERILLGKWTQTKLNELISESYKIKGAGSHIDFISENFLDTDYKESTLIGDINTPEVLVINLKGVDCFTFIDYVEAMRLSCSFPKFKKNLKRVRYRSGKVSFKNRNHFFTDWKEFNSDFVYDVTEQIGARHAIEVNKILNQREDKTYLLPGIPLKKRKIKYIPSDAVDDSVISKLRTGDYAGIYSTIQELDVSHVGIIIKRGSTTYLRHASSARMHRKVIDEDFRKYISNKPGLIILRPKDCP